jgi:predicted amino acid racemase
MTDTPNPRLINFENHIQTILTALLLAGVLWMASSINTMQQSVVVLQTEVKGLKERVATVNAEGYGAKNAAADLAIRDYRINEIERRLATLEEEK